jgi:hypothetical protein
MTELLEKEIAEVAKRPEESQDRIAAQLLRELEADAKWDASFAAPTDGLEGMAAEALEDYRAGRTEEKGFDEL